MTIQTVSRPFVGIACLVLAALLLSACISGPGPVQAAPSGGTSGQTTAPTPTPTPTPTPDLPHPPAMSRAEVEYAVFVALTACVGGLSADGRSVRVAFDTKPPAEERRWTVEAFSGDGIVTLGVWHVEDRSSLPVAPVDFVARRIATPSVRCAYPSVLLDGEGTPPHFASPDPTVMGQQSSGPVFTEDLAEMRVWSELYSCLQNVPAIGDFTALWDVGGKWLVEGRNATTSYGLWEVDAGTGAVVPWDDHARHAIANCGQHPAAITALQAEVRVWVATVDCFNGTRPALDKFTATPHGSTGWVVEGRYESQGAVIALYGLWLVETTGEIHPLDRKARTTVSERVGGEDCFKP